MILQKKKRNLISNVLISNIPSCYITRVLLYFFTRRESELKAFPHQLKEIIMCQIFWIKIRI